MMEISELWIWCAFGLSVFTCLIHIFAGGPSSVGPLLKSDLNDESKYTNYYCWHLVTITIATMAGGFIIAIYNPGAWELAAAATLLAGAFTIWSVILNLMVRGPRLMLPQWILFAPIAIFGIFGII